MSDFPSHLPGEATLEELLALAERLSAHPENRRGADKTWVLDGIRRGQAFFRDARRCEGPPTYDPPPRPGDARAT